MSVKGNNFDFQTTNMKPALTFFYFTAALILILSTGNTAVAQQYKLRQTTSMMEMKSESTIYVKGMRKRTEGGGYAGISNNIVTIEQCDLQRTIKLNDKKKLYFIVPFSKEADEVIDEDVKPAVKSKPVTPPPAQANNKKGGVITMWYNITDTGERKKMYGFTARHIWTTQKIKPSPDACTMKDSMIIKTDGWYIDLPLFNCPINYSGTTSTQNYQQQPECKDRFVTRRSGKGKLGFPLIETRTMIMGNGTGQTSEFKTDLETLELSTVKLDSMLFEIPSGYKLAAAEDELQDKYDVSEIMKQADNANKENGQQKIAGNEPKKQGVLRIGVYEPTGDGQLQFSALQQHLVNTLNGGSIEAVAITSEEDAKKYNCDLTLTTDFIKVKQASKVGGLLKAIKNTDPSAAASYNIEAAFTVKNVPDGSTRWQQNINGKYEGKPDDAAKKSLDEGSRGITKELK